jgi:lipoteichoic acid synthase
MKSSEYPLPKDSIKNLILILVESLSSYPINKSYGGIELTPNINKLLSKAYYNPNMVSEAQLGESSDGQFIYLTGLLPLKNSVTINEISANNITTFVSLAKEKYPNLHSQMTIPTEKDSWSQESMCRKYGIDTLFSKENYSKEVKDDWMNDQQLFEYAAHNDKHLKSPFISIILTSSMHSPYIKSYEKYDIKYPANFSSELKHYLDNVHYMDKYLGKYLESLKQFPWYDQCTIIITADHKPNGPKLNTRDDLIFSSIPLIIIKSPLNQQHVKPITQASLFPTILDLYHINSKWHGVDVSIFMPDSIRQSTYENKRTKYRQNISNYLNNNYMQ